MWQLFKSIIPSLLVLLIHNQHSEVENKIPISGLQNQDWKLSNLPNVTQPSSNKTKVQIPLSLIIFFSLFSEPHH